MDTILIVDDEPFNIDYLEQELEELNYACLRAQNGQEALECVAADMPDLVLLDIMMPVMDGFETLRHLKANPLTQHVPVIVISAMSDMDNVIRGIEMGADDYLSKPFNPVLLQARIRSSLEKKRLRDQEQLYLQALEKELAIGRQIQADFLPSELPNLVGWDMATYFEAAREVAGDFYDIFWLDSMNRLVILVGDVCDKGVGAALYMTLFRSLLRAFVNPEAFGLCTSSTDAQTRLHETVSLVNNYIATVHGDSNMFATLFFGLLDPLDGSLAYINAGQEPALVLDSTQIKARLGATGPIVGLFPDMTFSMGRINLEAGDMLVIYSDGIPDALNAAQVPFRDATFKLVIEATRGVSTTAALERMVNEVRHHIDGIEQSDDITLIALQRL